MQLLNKKIIREYLFKKLYGDLYEYSERTLNNSKAKEI